MPRLHLSPHDTRRFVAALPIGLAVFCVTFVDLGCSHRAGGATTNTGAAGVGGNSGGAGTTGSAGAAGVLRAPERGRHHRRGRRDRRRRRRHGFDGRQSGMQ